MADLISALRSIWLASLPWLTPALVGGLGLAGTWLGSDLSSIRSVWNGETSPWWKAVAEHKSIWAFVILFALYVATGSQQHREIKRLKNEAVEAKSLAAKKGKESAESRDKLTEAEETIETLRASLEKTLWENTSEYLRRCVRPLEFSVRERISVYVHTGEWFILAGRFSPSPDHNEARRRRFHSDEGCIGKAWTAPTTCHGTLPDPGRNLDHYLKMSLKRFGIPREVAAALRMKSRHYYARALQSQATGTRIGVVVLESLSSSHFDPGALDELIGRKEDHLVALIQQSASVSAFLLNPTEQEAS